MIPGWLVFQFKNEILQFEEECKQKEKKKRFGKGTKQSHLFSKLSWIGTIFFEWFSKFVNRHRRGGVHCSSDTISDSFDEYDEDNDEDDERDAYM